MGKFYARFREMLLDGAMVKALETRYTYGHYDRKVMTVGPRGGKHYSYKRCSRSVYYYAGAFYKIEKNRVKPGEMEWILAPIDGDIWDDHAEQSAAEGIDVCRFSLKAGIPISVSLNGAEQYDLDESEWSRIRPIAETSLKLVRIPRKSHK